MSLDYTAQHENLILQIILNAVNYEGADYLDTDSGQECLGLIGIKPEIAKQALTIT